MPKEKKLDPSALRSHIGYRMRVVSNAVSHAFAKKLAASEVTVAEWVVLREMYARDDRTSQSLIAELTGLTRGAISKLVERLVNKGLVTRTEALEDRRYQDIKLTASALRLVPKLASIADENDEGFFSVLTKAEQKMLMDVLLKLADLHKLSVHPVE